MANQTDNMAATDDQGGANVLRIVSGLHAGASRALAEQEMILVGSGEDCDIVLADPGVAGHHALISLVGGRFTLRALDAPLKVGTSVVHPGDPVDLTGVERVGMGEAALAFGDEHDPGWAAVLPGGAPGTRPSARPGAPYLRRLPAIAAVAALSLASLAIFAAVMPEKNPQDAPEAQLRKMLTEHAISDGDIRTDSNGGLVLTGTISDNAARERVRRQIEAQQLNARTALRTGEDIASDVQEVLRSQGLNARTRYLGNGDVEVSGSFEDEEALRTAAYSRAMRDVVGINRVLPVNTTPRAADAGPAQAQAAKPQARIRIAAIVRGKEPHVLDGDGNKYPVGADLPGRGQLIAITPTFAHALATDGSLQKLVVEAPPKADAPPGDDGGAVAQIDRSPFANVKGGIERQHM